MEIVTGFLLFLALTLVALGVTVVSGFKARRKIHIPAVAVSVVLLLVTIYYAEQLGTQYDLKAAGVIYPIHLLTTSWLAKLNDLNVASRFEVPRFRPNLVIDGAEEGFAELGWCGNQIRIGSATFGCDAPTIRCGMTTQPTADLPKDTQVLRTIVRDSDQNVGAYATIASPGTISVGDDVELL